MKTNYVLKQYISYINEDFYNNIDNYDELELFVKSFVVNYCKSLKLEAPTVSFKDLKSKFRLGAYIDKNNSLFLNKRFLTKFDVFKENNNLLLVYRLFDILLHELRHMEQYKGFSLHPLLKSITKKLGRHNPSKDKGSYFNNILEIDARNYSYTVLKDIEQTKAFVNSEYYFTKEKNRQKYSYSLFQDILDENDYSKYEDLAFIKANFYGLLKENKMDYFECFENYKKIAVERIFES